MTDRAVAAKTGWTPLEFYAFIVRTLGIPTSFRLEGVEWVGEGPFTRPVPELIDLLEARLSSRSRGYVG